MRYGEIARDMNAFDLCFEFIVAAGIQILSVVARQKQRSEGKRLHIELSLRYLHR